MERNADLGEDYKPVDWAKKHALKSVDLKNDIKEGQLMIEQILKAAKKQKLAAGQEMLNFIPVNYEGQ